MIRSFCHKKKCKNNNCKNNYDTTPLSEMNSYCTNQDSDLSICENLKKQAEHYAIQANCAKDQAINLENQARELECQMYGLYNQSKEFWNQYNQLVNEYNIYMHKANCCFKHIEPKCDNHCPCYKQNTCVSNTKPKVVCKKSGCCNSVQSN